MLSLRQQVGVGLLLKGILGPADKRRQAPSDRGKCNALPDIEIYDYLSARHHIGHHTRKRYAGGFRRTTGEFKWVARRS